MHRDLLLIPLLSVPMVYQLWLLWQEYQTGFTPEVYYRPEPVTDLPAITVCIPIKYAFRETFILHSIKQSTDRNNYCTHYKKYIGLNASIPDQTTDPSGWREMHLNRGMCYRSNFMHTNASDPIYLQNITRLPTEPESRWMLLHDMEFLSLELGCNIDNSRRSDAWPKDERSWKVRPNLKFASGLELCWTWFSRATRDWHEAAHRHVVSSEGQQESSLWTQSEASQRSRNEGVIVSRDHPRVWPYRLDGVSQLSLTLDFLQVLKSWLAPGRHKSMTELIEQETALRQGNTPFIRFMAHSPYEWEKTPKSWSAHVNDYLQLANETLHSDDLIIYVDWSLSYTKTTLQHLAVADQYSQYIGLSGSIYSENQCTRLVEIIDSIESHAIRNPDQPVCVKLGPLFALKTYDWMPDLPFCSYNMVRSQSLNETKLENDRILRLFRDRRPTSCPTDGQRIMFKMTDEEGPKSGKPTRGKSTFDGSQFKYSLTLYLDNIPELTIRYVYKMATIELLANGCGLCGIWIGFSFLWLISQIIDLATMDCAKQRFEALKRILKRRKQRTPGRPANLRQPHVQVIQYSHHQPVRINQPVMRVSFN